MAVAAHPGGAALAMAGRYLALLLVANLIWEVAQLPLYSLWTERSPGEIAQAVVHCTLGDGMIGAVSLGAAWLMTVGRGWPEKSFGQVAIVTTIFGVGATIVLEWLNVEVWRTWSYAAGMPRLPPLGTGLTPVLQWLLLPTLCLVAARRLAPAR
ncbi:hypothetical protein [Falsiroseomonas oryzae]|uniref:hypothetical protein n=1 Tax=Falsiroseomonas oryzae TaxID=2766473 RepID=UPI0022EABD47|nr:hypothetical protein [Roseomonas sp. MO-31]